MVKKLNHSRRHIRTRIIPSNKGRLPEYEASRSSWLNDANSAKEKEK
jgi:hypothetical protein